MKERLVYAILNVEGAYVLARRFDTHARADAARRKMHDASGYVVVRMLREKD